MDSDNNNDDDDRDASSTQVREYYKKFSQNKDLPKYFSGSSVSYMPEIVKANEIAEGPKIVVETMEEPQTEFEPRPTSPASSVASNKKLEWDNGADIGYSNLQKDNSKSLHKSFSLPTLSNVKIPSGKQVKLTSHIIDVISLSSNISGDGSSPAVKIAFSSSGSSDSPAAPPRSDNHSSTTTSSSNIVQDPGSMSSSKSLESLSAVKKKIGSPGAESTPKIPEPAYTETPENRPRKLSSKERGPKTITLCRTEAVLVECIDRVAPIEGSDKNIQTSDIETSAKSIQTGDSLKNIIGRPPPGQSVIIINRDTDSSKTKSSSEIVAAASSYCDSFEYLIGDRIPEPKQATASSSSISDNNPLADLISKQHSTSLIADIDKSIELLQKLVRSKKYDPTTKKRYVKKIVQKILTNKYLEDSTSSSSELLMPNLDGSGEGRVVASRPPHLQDNLPWYPAMHPGQSAGFVQQISSGGGGYRIGGENGIKETGGFTASAVVNPVGTEDLKQTSTSTSSRSWKEPQTLSERLFEARRGEGDQLVNYAKKERQHQIAWINDEITHLSKLKQLLQKNYSNSNKFQGVKKTTTVYMVSQDYAKDSAASSSGSNHNNKPPRNYVIQTELESSSSSDHLEFNYHDQNMKGTYHIRNTLQKKTDKKSPTRMLGNIEVVSDDNTTNIKVKAKKIPPNNNNNRYQSATYPRSTTETRFQCNPCIKTTTTTRQPCNILVNEPSQICTGQYTFELPLERRRFNLSERVDDVLERHSRKSSICGDCCNSKTECCCRKENVCCCSKLKDKVQAQACDCAIRNKIQCCSKTICQCCPSHENKKVPEKPNNNINGTDKCPVCGTCKPQKIPLECLCQNAALQCPICPTINHQEAATSQSSSPVKTKPVQKECTCNSATQCPPPRPPSPIKTQTTCQCNSQTQYPESRPDPQNEQTQTEQPAGSSETLTESVSISAETESSDSERSLQSCCCCKNKSTPPLYSLRQKLSDESYPLCRPCYQQYSRYPNSPIFNQPGHICNCFTMVRTKTLDEVKQTITDLNDLEHCTCSPSKNRNGSNSCQYCKCKLKKTAKNRHGIAYLLTLEEESPRSQKAREEKRKEKKRGLEEIKVKIPVSRKKSKEMENRKKKEKRRSSNSSSSKSSPAKLCPVYTLQEYLQRNKPDFVQTADERRKNVLDTMIEREEFKEKRTMMILENNFQKPIPPKVEQTKPLRIFSAKEMRQITKKNYHKLPEVQRKLLDNRDKQIKQANRLIADTFNKKLKDNVLKGKINLPTDKNVVG